MGLLIFHSVYSIGLPIFLFGLVFPGLKRKSLVSNKGLGISILALTLDSIILSAVVNYDPGAGLILFSTFTITILVAAAKKLPGDFLKTKLTQPKWRPLNFAVIGSLLFPATLFTGALAAGANAPPIVPSLLDIFFTSLLLTLAFRSMGTGNNQEHKVALAIGLLIPIAIFGIIASIALGNPLIVLADISFVLFSRRLWNKWHHWTLIQRSGMQTTLPGFTGSPGSPLPR